MIGTRTNPAAAIGMTEQPAPRAHQGVAMRGESGNDPSMCDLYPTLRGVGHSRTSNAAMAVAVVSAVTAAHPHCA